ncbi:hypothetical protein [Chryseobacterium sp. Leaf180]|uniref:hypothetical protein n=1 Tax=Chryseobacterium sp. Leaf180 TaxID=1736289 RepID=UPI000ABBC16C|nr:hypothetical protein [Chryseobacterium sp. Leaf180]
MEAQKIFRETQKFTQWWLWLLLAVICTVTVLNFTSTPEAFSTAEIIFGIIILALIAILIFIARLETIIDEQGIRARFFPFHINFRYFPWRSIKKINVRTYAPLQEYGGWGIRGFFGRGKAYNIKGNKGIQLLLNDEKHLLIGTQKPQEAENVLNYYTNNGFPTGNQL